MRLVSYGDPAAPAVVVAPGVGSRAEFVAACFADAAVACGHRLVTYDPRGLSPEAPLRDPSEHTLACHAAALADAVAETGARVAGGISIGGLAALTLDVEAVVVALPGELGTPVHTDVERYGVRGVLDRMAADPGVPRWVAEEVAAAWSMHDEAALLAALRAVAAEPPFVPRRRADVVVAATDDPMHPVSAAYPLGDPVLTTLAAMGRDRSVLGRLALAPLDEPARHQGEGQRRDPTGGERASGG